jgi:hypothetical protein
MIRLPVAGVEQAGHLGALGRREIGDGRRPEGKLGKVTRGAQFPSLPQK